MLIVLGKVFFWTFGIPKPLKLFRGSSSLQKKQSGTAKGLLLGPCFFAEGPPSKNTFGKLTHKQIEHEDTSRSYDPGSFSIATCLEMKSCTDLKRKRPIGLQ